MNIQCNREDLSSALQIVSSVIQQRSTIPILSNIKMTVSSKGKKGAGILDIMGTDLEVGIHSSIRLDHIVEGGTLVLPAQRLTSIVRENTDDIVQIQSDGHLAQVSCGGSEYKLIGADPTEYPVLPEFDASGSFFVEKDLLTELIQKTQFSVSTELVRYALTGLLFEIPNKKTETQELRMVASDGKRMAYIRKSQKGRNENHAGNGTKVLIPPKALILLTKLLAEEDELVSVSVDESQIKFKTNHGMVFARLIEGNFPDYEQVVPKALEHKVVLNTQAFASSLKRVSFMSPDKTKIVKLDIQKGKMTLFTRSQDIGEAKITMEVEYSGPNIDVVFNPDYLIDFTRVIESPTIELHLKDRSSAGIFRDDKYFTYVVMPLTVQI